MEHIMVLVSAFGSMFLSILLGYIAARLGLITPQGRKCLTDLIIDIIFPCYVINGFMKNIGMLSGGDMLFMFGTGLAVLLCVLVFGHVFYRNAPDERRSILRYGTMVPNTAYLGLPMVGSLMGSAGNVCASLYVIPIRIATFGFGVNYFTPATNGIKGNLKKTITHPAIVATIIGIFIMMTGMRPPEFLCSAISSVAACSTPLSMMTVGAVIYAFQDQMRIEKTILVYTVLRLILIPGVIYAVFRGAGLDRILIGTATLLNAMPMGTTAALFADKYGKDVAFAGALIMFSTLCSLVTIPLWSYICLFL